MSFIQIGTAELCRCSYVRSEIDFIYVEDFLFKTFKIQSIGDFECHHCGKNVKTKRTLISHMGRHYRKYLCTSCDYVCLSLRQMHLHNSTHRRLFECLKCGEGFSKRSAFYKHYSSVHTRVVCDHCNKSICSKNKLISHIRRLHTNHICTPCNHKFSTHDALQRHRRLTHSSSSSELSYCVECDLQFDNVYRYRRHINSSMKHKVKVGVPCPVCKRVYHKTWAMNNHYKLVHLKQTDYYCGLCSRYFLNGYRHRQHVARVHDNIAPTRDKVCTICGRGFSTNRILSNHVRSHTGERPHACEHCDAKFTQKYSLRTHTRTVHKLQ